MHNSLSTSIRILSFAFITFFFILTDSTNADYSGVGDIDGDVANAGHSGSAPGDLIVGDFGTAGIFGDAASPLAGGTLFPLRSDLSIIGNEFGSIGAVTLEDFVYVVGENDPYGGNWLIEEELSVGNNGQGFLDMLNSARVEVAEDMWIGGADDSADSEIADTEHTGYGLVTINGTGTRLVTGDEVSDTFYIGFDGVGEVDITGRGSIETRGDAVIGEEDDADGLVRISDLGSWWTIAEDLFIGNGESGSNTAHGTLEINTDAWVQVGEDAEVHPSGTIVLAGGNFELLDPTSNLITNDGIIKGHGYIDGPITNNSSGQIRNQSAAVINGTTVTNEREYLRISGEVVSSGLIESIGGEMEFENLVTSTGDIVARDAIMRFRAKDITDPGLAYDLIVDDGTLYLKDKTTVYGDINFSAGAFFDVDPEVVQVGNFTITALAAASTSSTLQPAMTSESSGFNVTVSQSDHFDITGFLDLGSGITDLGVTYDDEEPTEIGDILTVISAGGGISGQFANDYVYVDNLFWEIGYSSNEVFITAASTTMPTVPEDLNGDGFVDGLDLGILLGSWGTSTTPELGELDGTPPVDGLDLGIFLGAWSPPPAAATAAVPEPTTALLMMMGIVCVGQRKLR